MSLKKSIFTAEGKSYLFPFILVTSLFFLWGFAHSILDVLNKHFQEYLHISKTQSALVQTVLYGAYFFMALPAGKIISRFGYRIGVIVGLVLYGIGALLFVPGETIGTFWFFLICLTIIGCGLTCLETAANPYVTVLGDKDGAARRINLSQSFNGLGWIVGPFVGSWIILGSENGSVALPYMVIGIVVLLVALFFSRIKLPEIIYTSETETYVSSKKLWSHKRFVFGVLALFFYVASQTGVNSFFINFVTEELPSISSQDAGYMLSLGGMGLFVIGRIVGSWVMRIVRVDNVLKVCAFMCCLTMVLVMGSWGIISVIALLCCYLFESIMFPTIFAIAIQGLDESLTKKASPYLIMSIVGGAIAPVIMGYIGDTVSIAIAYVIPLICFAYVLGYTIKCCK